jgi:hypothetical protein
MLRIFLNLFIEHAPLPLAILHAMLTYWTICLERSSGCGYPPPLYNWSFALISHLSLAWFSYVLIAICYRSSKSIDSIKAINEFLYFVTSSCLLAGQFPFWIMHCFRTSLCVWIVVHWFSRWSVVWSPCPQMHVASSRSLKRLRYALVLPCPVSIAARFGVRLIFILSLSCTVGKYCLVVAALVHVVHSSCHFCVCVCVCVWCVCLCVCVCVCVLLELFWNVLTVLKIMCLEMQRSCNTDFYQLIPGMKVGWDACWGTWWPFSYPLYNCWDHTLKLVCSVFLPRPCQFIIIVMQSFDTMQYRLNC